MSRVIQINDLRLQFDSALIFSPYDTQMTRWGLCSLGSVCLFLRDFQFPRTLLKYLLHLVFLNLNMPLSSVVEPADIIDNVYSMYNGLFINIYASFLPDPLCIIVSLSARRKRPDLLFLYKVLQVTISCLELPAPTSYCVRQ